MTRRKMRRGPVLLTPPEPEPRGVGSCPVPGCWFATDEMDPTAATMLVVRHLAEAHENPGVSYEIQRGQFGVEDRPSGLAGTDPPPFTADPSRGDTCP